MAARVVRTGVEAAEGAGSRATQQFSPLAERYLAGWIRALYFGDFLLGQQKKVIRQPGGLRRALTQSGTASQDRTETRHSVKPG